MKKPFKDILFFTNIFIFLETLLFTLHTKLELELIPYNKWEINAYQSSLKYKSKLKNDTNKLNANFKFKYVNVVKINTILFKIKLTNILYTNVKFNYFFFFLLPIKKI